jgi:hypothetical protein
MTTSFLQPGHLGRHGAWSHQAEMHPGSWQSWALALVIALMYLKHFRRVAAPRRANEQTRGGRCQCLIPRQRTEGLGQRADPRIFSSPVSTGLTLVWLAYCCHRPYWPLRRQPVIWVRSPCSRTNTQILVQPRSLPQHFLVSGVAAPVVILREGRFEEEEDKRCKRECDELDEALDEIGDKVLSGLAKSNFKQMKVFTIVALRQARMSFYMSVVAASIALLVLLSGGAVTVVLTGTSAKVAAASLTTVGAVLGGFVSTTFLRTYWMAARQMSYYYGQPLVHCYLLHAEWLALMLAEHPDRKVDASLWERVLEASIRAGENAQAHLLTLQEQSFNRSQRMPDAQRIFGPVSGVGTQDNHNQ